MVKIELPVFLGTGTVGFDGHSRLPYRVVFYLPSGWAPWIVGIKEEGVKWAPQVYSSSKPTGLLKTD